MTRPFRYVDETSDAAVTLHLFKTLNGTPRGDVRGPSSRHPDGRSDVCDMEACLPVALAFTAAVRMANRNNVELVVSGDRELWDVAWGLLTGPLPVVVLVVEDEALVRMSIAGLMADDGFVVLEAGNALEALALLTGNPAIRMMFTDVDMPPGMDGLGLAVTVRDRWPLVQIIVTSGRRTVETSDMPDGSTFFSKPYRHEAVMASMRQRSVA
jgi:CheY-like chemotaxis protein